MYLIAFTFWYLRRPVVADKQDIHEKHLKEGRRLRLGCKVMEAFRGSLKEFLRATMSFSLVMLSAALYVSAEKTTEHTTSLNNDQWIPAGSALYDRILSLLASTFSVFPVTTLYAMQRWWDNSDRSQNWWDRRDYTKTKKHEVWISRTVLILIWALAVAEVFLSPRGEHDYKWRHSVETEKRMTYSYCDQRGGIPYWHGMKAAQIMVIIGPLFWLFVTLFVLTGLNIPGVVDRPWVARLRSAWFMAVPWINVLFMWGLLAYFTVLRYRINVTAGHLDAEDE